MSTVIMRMREEEEDKGKSKQVHLYSTNNNVLYTKHKATQGSIKSIYIQKKKKELNRKSCSVSQ